MSERSRSRRFAVAVVALVAAACGGAGGGPGGGAALQSVTIDPGRVYAVVGVPQQLTITGHYADGRAVPLDSGITWQSSDASVAAVTASGLIVPNAQGDVQIRATYSALGLSDVADVTSREVVALTPAALPRRFGVDRTAAFFRVLGLTPGAMYAPAASDMTDDVDLFVFSEASMTSAVKLCGSKRVGVVVDSCVAPATSLGELWIAVDGFWTRAGAGFTLDVPEARRYPIAATLVPADFPYASSIGITRLMYEVTGLTPGVPYEVRVSNLSANVDLEVFSDDYKYRSLCESYQGGTVDDFCTATSTAAGELFVELDGETSIAGGSFTLTVTAR